APASQQPAVIATVLVHEFGHELGLVGIVGTAPNQDPNHPYHSNDPNDVMYWAVETTGVLVGLLGGSPPPTQFDAADLSDLASVRSAPIFGEIIPWIVAGGAALGAAVVALVALRSR